MSEFLAEASVLIRPDTTGFRAALEKQLLAATKGIVVPVSVVATGASDRQAALTSLAAAQNENARAASAAGAAATKNAAATLEEAKANKLATASARALALAQEEVVGAASSVGAAQIRETRAAAAVAAAERQLAFALASTNLEYEKAAGKALLLAEAEQKSALAALADARAQAKRAASGSQVQRAFLAQGAAAAGLRGAVLSSTAAFLGATVAAVGLVKAVKAASDLNEEVNKTKEVFRGSAKAILDWSKTTSTAIGTSRTEALKAIGTFGELFKTLNIGTPQAADLSETLVQLAADLSSFFNAAPQDTLRALQSGLVGQARPLRQFGVFLTEARVKTEALAETGKRSAASLTQQDKILARYNLILKDSAIASGDFARTEEGLANQSRVLKANIEDVGGSLGNLLLPAVLFIVEGLNALVTELHDVAGVAKTAASGISDLAQQIEKSSPAQFVVELIEKVPGGGTAKDFFKNLKADIEIAAGGALVGVGIASSEIGVGIPVAAAGAVVFAKGLKDLNGASRDASKELRALQDEFRRLKEAQDAAAKGGADDVAQVLGKRAAIIRRQIEDLIKAGRGLDTSLSAPLREAADALREVIKLHVGDLGFDPGPIRAWIKELEHSAAVSDQTEGNINRLRGDVDGLGTSARNSAGGVDALTKALKDLSRQSSVLDAQLLKLQNENASPQAIILNRQADIAAQNKIIADLKANGNQPGDASAITAARKQIEADQAEIEQQQGILKSETKKAADDAQKKADDIASNRLKATQAFISAFDPAKQKILNAITAAGLTERLSDDIKFEKQLVVFLKAEINAIKDRIKRLHLHGDALKAAQAAIKTLNQEIFNTLQDIASDQAQQQQRTQDILNEKIDLRIRIAQAREDVPAEIKARTARLNAITAQLAKLKNAHKKNTVAWLELKAQQIEEINAINELKGKSKEKSDTQSQFFNFLQTQQGFAANLLGNLIPGFATSGLVGNVSPAGPESASAAAVGANVQTSAQINRSQELGVRPIQVDRTNQLLQQILAALQGRHTTPPEIAFNKGAGSSSFDTQ